MLILYTIAYLLFYSFATCLLIGSCLISTKKIFVGGAIRIFLKLLLLLCLLLWVVYHLAIISIIGRLTFEINYLHLEALHKNYISN